MASTMSIATSVLQALRYCAPQNKGYEGILVFDYFLHLLVLTRPHHTNSKTQTLMDQAEQVVKGDQSAWQSWTIITTE